MMMEGALERNKNEAGSSLVRGNALLVSSFDFNLQILVVDLINSSCRHIYMQLISRGGAAQAGALFCHGGLSAN